MTDNDRQGLTEAERETVWLAGDHAPELCDCAGSDWSADGEWCGDAEGTFAAVERILSARRVEWEAERLAPLHALADELAWRSSHVEETATMSRGNDVHRCRGKASGRRLAHNLLRAALAVDNTHNPTEDAS